METEEKKQVKSTDEVKKSSKVPIFAGILIFIFIISFFAYSKFRPFSILPENYYRYNNFEFRKISGLWVTEVYNPKTKTVYSLPLHYGPKELEEIEANPNTIHFLKLAYSFKGPKNQSATFVTYDPDINDSQISLAYYELSQHLWTALNIETLPTVTHEVEHIENETIRTCENTDEPVIYLRYKSPAYVDFKNNCLIIQGEGTDLVKAADRALYVFYNVMK